jgi:hypothetical protein
MVNVNTMILLMPSSQRKTEAVKRFMFTIEQFIHSLKLNPQNFISYFINFMYFKYYFSNTCLVI